MPVHKDMMKYLYDKGQGTGQGKEEVGSVLYMRGMIIRDARRRGDPQRAGASSASKVVTGEQVRWGAGEPEPRRSASSRRWASRA